MAAASSSGGGGALAIEERLAVRALYDEENKALLEDLLTQNEELRKEIVPLTTKLNLGVARLSELRPKRTELVQEPVDLAAREPHAHGLDHHVPRGCRRFESKT